jgi:hypothetical protein
MEPALRSDILDTTAVVNPMEPSLRSDILDTTAVVNSMEPSLRNRLTSSWGSPSGARRTSISTATPTVHAVADATTEITAEGAGDDADDSASYSSDMTNTQGILSWLSPSRHRRLARKGYDGGAMMEGP